MWCMFFKCLLDNFVSIICSYFLLIVMMLILHDTVVLNEMFILTTLLGAESERLIEFIINL